MSKYIHTSWLPISFAILCLTITLCADSLSYIPLLLIIFSVFDLRSRLHEMNRLMGRRFNKRVALLFSTSRCQRNMLIGIYGEDAKVFLYSLGYRWWHFLPDMLIEHPIKFFHPTHIKHAYFK